MNKFSKIKFGDGLAVTDEGEGVIRVDGTGGGGSPATEDWTVITKASDESVTSSTTIQKDNELFFTTTSGAFYAIEAYIIATGKLSGPSAAGDIKLALGESETIAFRGILQGIGLNTSDGGYFAQIDTRILDGATAHFGLTTEKRVIHIFGAYERAGGGDLALWWAQATSDAVPTTIYAGSELRYREFG